MYRQIKFRIVVLKGALFIAFKLLLKDIYKIIIGLIAIILLPFICLFSSNKYLENLAMRQYK